MASAEIIRVIINKLSSVSVGIKAIPEVYKDFYLELTENVLFIDDLFHNSSRTILVQQPEIDVPVRKQHDDDEVDSNLSTTGRLDLTGSPLKDDYADDDFEFTENVVVKQSLGYRPVNLKNARWLLSYYNRYIGSNSVLPIGIVCDGMRENIIFLGCQLEGKEFNWKCVKLSPNNGQIKNSLENLKLKHNIGLKMKKIDQIDVLSSYELSSSNLISDLNNKTNFITAYFKWKDCKIIFESPQSNALCNLMIKGNPNRLDSIVSNHYEELQILEVLKTLVSSIQNPVNDITTDENSVVKVKNKLLQLFQKLKGASIFGVKTKTSIEDGEIVLPYAIRQREFDITDHLWNILKGHYNMPKLILQCMELVATEWKSVQHVLFKDNTTKLVKLLSGGTQTSVLSEKLCLEYLFDIGIKKLQRDYINFIVGSELATKDLVENFLKPSQIINSDITNNLKRLHYAVDLIISCAMTLSLSSQWLRQLTRHILSEMQTKSEGDVIEYQTAAHLIQPLISRENFIKWQVRLLSDENSYKKVTTYQITRSWPNWIENSEEYCHVICDEIWDKTIL